MGRAPAADPPAPPRRGASDWRPRVWLIGEHNPHSADPRDALLPYPAGAAGDRLASMLLLSDDDYLAAFERRNLLSAQQWSVPAARAAAREILSAADWADALVLLGARVAAAFGVAAAAPRGAAWLGGAPWLLAPCDVLYAPHPSGRSRAWNDPTLAPRTRAAIIGLLTDRQQPAAGGEVPAAG